MLPELLTPIRPRIQNGLRNLDEAARFILDDSFWAQQKRDGERLMVRRYGQQVHGWNKQGQTTAVPPVLTSALLSISVPHFILDGEYERTAYYCWDLLRAGDEELTTYAYGVRYEVLQPFAACPFLQILPSYKTSEEKERIVFELLENGAEGVVFKDRRAPYKPGRARQHFKLKFVKTATVRVHSVDPSRNRAVIELVEGGQWRQVSGLKVERGSVRPGDYVEVSYLTASENKNLVQPVFLHLRHDVTDEDCSTEQLEFSGRWSHLRHLVQRRK